MSRRKGTDPALRRTGHDNPRVNMHYVGGVINGVELVASRNGHYTYRVGSLHSGNAAHATEKSTNELRRELESELSHIQHKLKGHNHG